MGGDARGRSGEGCGGDDVGAHVGIAVAGDERRERGRVGARGGDLRRQGRRAVEKRSGAHVVRTAERGARRREGEHVVTGERE